MNFMGTQMHMVTFMITVFEVVMLFFQIIYFLERENDKKRFLYLILLVLLILYNVTSGLFPDENIPIPVMLQTIVAYLFAFGTSMYFVYYKGTEVSRKSVAALVVKLIDNPKLEIRKNLGVNKPNTDGDKPSFY